MRFNFLFINLFLNLSIFYLFLINYNPLCINSYFYLPLNSLRKEEGIYKTFLLLGLKSEFISPLIEDVISFLFISFFFYFFCAVTACYHSGLNSTYQKSIIILNSHKNECMRSYELQGLFFFNSE